MYQLGLIRLKGLSVSCVYCLVINSCQSYHFVVSVQFVVLEHVAEDS